MTTIDQKIGAIIHEQRLKLGWSQQFLGNRMGISAQQVQKYEKGTNSLTAKRMIEMADALYLHPQNLLRDAVNTKVVKLPDSPRKDLEIIKRINLLKPHEHKAVVLLINTLCHERMKKSA